MGLMDKDKETLVGSSQPASTSSTPSTAHPTATNQTTSSPTSPTTASVPQLPKRVVFDSANVTVIFVLGGPGAGEAKPRTAFPSKDLADVKAGKGTQCERLVADYGFKHLSGELACLCGGSAWTWSCLAHGAHAQLWNSR